MREIEGLKEKYQEEYMEVGNKSRILMAAQSVSACFLGLRVRMQPGYGCLCLTNVMCCRVEVLATGPSLVQGSPKECVCL